MKWVLLTIIVAACVSATSATAASLDWSHCNANLTPRTELRCAQQNKYHALGKIQWARYEQRRVRPLSFDALQTFRLNRMLVDNRWLYKLSVTKLVEARARIAASLRPAHYALWMCIHGDRAYRHAPGGEGAWGATNPNGHYNGLQMTWGWGELVGNPNDYSPMQILWAAEHAYAASGYSRTWLNGQWSQTIGPCWQYA